MHILLTDLFALRRPIEYTLGPSSELAFLPKLSEVLATALHRRLGSQSKRIDRKEDYFGRIYAEDTPEV